MLSYDAFRAGDKGRAIAALASDAAIITAMEQWSVADEPAVAALDAPVAESVGALDHTERQHAGRIVRDALAPLGWRPVRRKRVRDGRVFTSGAIYARVVSPEPTPVSSTAEWAATIDAARARLADVKAAIGTVDDFLAERRREAGRAR